MVDAVMDDNTAASSPESEIIKISDSGEALAHYMFVYLESTFRPEIVVLPDVTRARRILNEIKSSIVQSLIESNKVIVGKVGETDPVARVT